jgi:hypothetical protein
LPVFGDDVGGRRPSQLKRELADQRAADAIHGADAGGKQAGGALGLASLDQCCAQTAGEFGGRLLGEGRRQQASGGKAVLDRGADVLDQRIGLARARRGDDRVDPTIGRCSTRHWRPLTRQRLR